MTKSLKTIAHDIIETHGNLETKNYSSEDVEKLRNAASDLQTWADAIEESL